ncbi:flagellar hook-length control protein FliK [Gellertiella hungarica]|uniref:Chemotaxis protein MotD n=1 Tax=Gellertiella hungarica TaxID=1572859 RepID=A0A7W6NK32_9HYPH|nr:flagellar hook-length control protein FliK [Gellertiella hungarica]MBB4064134.1 chemotaxis protein MotD [Gellertiella hungarica]
MMDAMLAATTPPQDLKVQPRQGGKSDKADAKGQSSFKNTLDERLGKPGNGHPGRVGPDAAKSLDAGDDSAPKTEKPDLDGHETAADETVKTPKKPVILLTRPVMRSENAGQNVSDDSRKGGNGIGESMAGEHARADVENLMHGAAAGKAEREEVDLPDTAKAPPEVQDRGLAKAHGHEPRKAADDSDEATDLPSSDSGQQSDAPAKDALVLLKDGAGHAGASNMAAHRADAGDAPVTDGEGSEASRGAVYRVSRADGKGATVDLPVQAAADDGDAKSAFNAAINQVTVLEQRRYLAPTDTNSLAIINSISGDAEWVHAMQPDQALANAAAQAGTGRVVNTLKIQMHPIELGLVTATMRLAGDELTVELKVDNGAAYRSLKEDQSRIIEALKSQGLSVDQVTVTLAPDRSDTAASGNQQNGQASGFAQQQQQARNGQDMPTGRERRMNEQERAGNGSGGADENRVETSASGLAGGARPGHVYL